MGPRIRARLARVELDPVIEQLRIRLATAADAILTATGQPRVGGPLRQAEDDLAVLETELATLGQTRADLDSAHHRYQLAAAVVSQLEKEHADRERTAGILRDQALALERLPGELETRRHALATAQERPIRLAADADRLAKLRGDVTAAQAGLAQAEFAALAAASRLNQLRNQLDAQQAARPLQESQLNTVRADLQRLQLLLKLRQLATTASVLSRQLTQTETVATEVASLEARKSHLPTLTPAKVRKLEELAESIRTLRAQLQALGLTVELTPDQASSVVIQEGSPARAQPLPAGQTTRWHSP